MKQVLLFPDHETSASAPALGCYLALSASTTGEALRALTPSVMQWEEDVWLLDLSSCISYWQVQATLHKRSLTEELSSQLHQLLIAKDLDHIAQPYTATLSQDPWLGVLHISWLRERGLSGFFPQQSRILNNISSSLSWGCWWRCCDQYVRYAASSHERSKFLKAKRSMQLAMRRLGFQSPQAAKVLPASQMRRRFGSLLAELWERSFTQSPNSPSPTISFPWSYLKYEEPRSISRHLDTILAQWDDIADFLRSDLNRLCLLDSFKEDQRILELEWRIVLYNLQDISLSIPFRHPHSLHHEAPHQRTALLQISYILEHYQRLQKDLGAEPCWISGWELRITQSWKRPPLAHSLFEPEQQEAEALLTLENQLQCPLETYQIQNDWVPEDSFASKGDTALISSEQTEALSLLGRQRPLFLLRNIRSFSTEGQSRLWKFRERTMDKWWVRHRTPNMVRDYYQVLTQDRLAWVFRDAQGQFFMHGIYG